jgi:hypothetical protein
MTTPQNGISSHTEPLWSAVYRIYQHFNTNPLDGCGRHRHQRWVASAGTTTPSGSSPCSSRSVASAGRSCIRTVDVAAASVWKCTPPQIPGKLYNTCLWHVPGSRQTMGINDRNLPDPCSWSTSDGHRPSRTGERAPPTRQLCRSQLHALPVPHRCGNTDGPRSNTPRRPPRCGQV